ncbi:hypothetical protein J1N35_005534, partial [Gossypium stocksii]
FNIEEIRDKHFKFSENITSEGLAKVSEDLCVEGTQWIISSQECYTVERAILKPIGK